MAYLYWARRSARCGSRVSAGAGPGLEADEEPLRHGAEESAALSFEDSEPRPSRRRLPEAQPQGALALLRAAVAWGLQAGTWSA